MNSFEKFRTDAWVVRVQGKEYGPVSLEELRAWKLEGRLIAENEVREPNSANWHRADELVEIFGDAEATAEAPAEPAIQHSLGEILARTWRIYAAGFWQFLGLTALVIVPSICAQLSGVAIGAPANGDVDLRSAVVAVFNFAMQVASLCAWPIYIAGIQILTREIAGGRSIAWREIVTQAFAYWPRIVRLCVLVYGAFVLLTVLAFVILAMVTVGATSIAIVLLALGLLILQVWMFGRVFVNVLFWQQAAVLENTGTLDSLRRSKELARGRLDLPRFRRPSFRGVVVASLWCAFATALTIGPQWTALTVYFQNLSTVHDPQALLESINALSKPVCFLLPLALGVLQAIFRPLLGIAFVLLYFDAKAP